MLCEIVSRPEYKPAGMVDDWLHEWSRWVRGDVYPDIPKCVSVESKYRSPQCWDAPEPQEPPLREWIGFRVERAVNRLPALEMRAIRAEVTTIRQAESESAFYERKRRLAHVPAWQYWSLVASAIKYLCSDLNLVE